MPARVKLRIGYLAKNNSTEFIVNSETDSRVKIEKRNLYLSAG